VSLSLRLKDLLGLVTRVKKKKKKKKKKRHATGILERFQAPRQPALCHPGVELRANLKSISHRCHLFEVAFVWELTKETIHLPLGCLQGGFRATRAAALTMALLTLLYSRDRS